MAARANSSPASAVARPPPSTTSTSPGPAASRACTTPRKSLIAETYRPPLPAPATGFGRISQGGAGFSLLTETDVSATGRRHGTETDQSPDSGRNSGIRDIAGDTSYRERCGTGATPAEL